MISEMGLFYLWLVRLIFVYFCTLFLVIKSRDSFRRIVSCGITFFELIFTLFI